jgi:hypothetical protein
MFRTADANSAGDRSGFLMRALSDDEAAALLLDRFQFFDHLAQLV